MKFLSILLALFTLSSLVVAIPAPVAEANALSKYEAVSSLQKRTIAPLVDDVQSCIDKCNNINQKYSGQQGSGAIKSWSAEIIIVINILIEIIRGYPGDCQYPSIDIVVEIFVKLFVAIFVQLQLFISVSGGLLGVIVVTVEILLAILLEVCGNLLTILVQLFLLIEVKIGVGICQKIITGCLGPIDNIFIAVFIRLLVQAGLNISL